MSASGLIRLHSKEEVRRHLKGLVEHYQAQSEAYGDQLGVLLRNLEQEKGAIKSQPKDSKDKDKGQGQKALARGWTKAGSLFVNVSDPNAAMAELLFQLHEDVKTRLAKSTEALKSFEEMGSTLIPEAGLYYLQVRNGVPEKLVVDLHESKKDTFNFSADFKLV
jgi:hypothetical protein